MARNLFTDPATPSGPRNPYVWPANHSEEQADGRQRTLNVLQPAAAGWKPTRPVRQQGIGGPRTLKLAGTALTEEQHVTFLRFLELSRRHSVHFTHFDGSAYEVIVTTYEPTRERVVRAPKGGTRLWRYVIEMEVLNEL